MTKVDGVILEGEKLGLEKYSGKDNKMMVDLHILNGFESVKLRVRDNDLVKKLDEYPNKQEASPGKSRSRRIQQQHVPDRQRSRKLGHKP